MLQALQLTVDSFGKWIFLGGASQEIIYHSASTNIIFKENPDQNALEYLAFGKDFVMDRLTARNLNENLENNL